MNAPLQTQSKAPAKLSFGTTSNSPFLQRKCACGGSAAMTGACEPCQGKKLSLQRSPEKSEGRTPNAGPLTQNGELETRNSTGVSPLVHEVLRSEGEFLPSETRQFFESRFGDHGVSAGYSTPESTSSDLTVSQPGDRYEREADEAAARVMSMPVRSKLPGAPDRQHIGHDFSRVRVHTDRRATESAQAMNAQAYTVGTHIVFGAEQYAPQTTQGRDLLAHELAHVLQQTAVGAQSNLVQCRNLTSPRLLGNPLFDRVLNNRAVIEVGDHGSEVRRIQQLLMDLGFDLHTEGTDGRFGSETEAAVQAFQRSHGLADDGRVGSGTIDALDRAFPALALPVNRSAPWTMGCVLGILCPWNRHLVEDVLPTFNIITFNSRSFPTQTWDGAAWQPGTFHSGGFRSGTNMGFLNSTTCEQMAFTIYHEGWHAQQATSLTGVVETERDAYINAEQWSISAGVPGQTFRNTATGLTQGLRTTRGGETVVDEPAAETLVRQGYGGVSATPGERVLSRVGASDVHVRRPDGSEYDRPAQAGESVRGAVSMPGQNPIDPADWDCP